MGKSLVIKGANFSENGITAIIGWIAGYSNTILQGESGKVVSSATVYFPISSEVTRLGLVGKTIKYIKLNAASAGTVVIYKHDSEGNSELQSFSVSSGKNTLELTTPIEVTDDTISIGIKGNGIIRYWSGSVSYTSRGWQYAESGPARVPIDFGYEI